MKIKNRGPKKGERDYTIGVDSSREGAGLFLALLPVLKDTNNANDALAS
jgi:hypothetical protein